MSIHPTKPEILKRGFYSSNFWANITPYITLIHYQRIITQLLNELIESEDELTLFREILSASSDPILITDPQMKIVYVNPAWEKMSGYNINEIIGKDVDILEREKTPKKIYQKIWRSLNHNKPYRTEEVIERKKDGSECQVYSSFFPVQKNKRPIFYVQIQHDITERKRIENQKKEFLATAAHELKTPITTLKLLLNSLSKRVHKIGTTDEISKELGHMDHELNRLTGLINDILDVSRAETGKLHLKPKKIDINDLVQRTVEKIQLVVCRQKITIRKNATRTLVVADPDRIEQVIINLLTNASKFSSPQSTIEVSISQKGNLVIVAVRDHGVGIPKKDLPFIFDRFYQSKKHKSNGFGLGLYIAKQIVLNHRGRIWAESNTGKNKGSIFHFSLPSKD